MGPEEAEFELNQIKTKGLVLGTAFGEKIFEVFKNIEYECKIIKIIYIILKFLYIC